ncbi:MAG TPA: hypothetical protein VFM64_04115 [Candidatus Nitrosotenuis sp.]|nr:hypothetical protein [Candidatus Nitrosotenuis sp.]
MTLRTITLVFSNRAFIALGAAIFSAVFLTLSSLSEYLFFSPYFVFYVPLDRLLGFSLILAVSALASVVIPMNVYQVRLLRSANGAGVGLFGSIVGASAGACGCGPIGFSIISAFGTVGGMTTAFLSTYEIPLRIASVGFLAFVYYTTTRSLGKCDIIKQKEPPESEMGSHEIGPGKDDSGHSCR